MRLSITLIILIYLYTSCLAGDWPQYLGPDRNAVSSETDFNTDWKGKEPSVLWQQSLGEGFASAAVNKGKAYLLDRVDSEKDVFRCFDLQTGEELWRFEHSDTGNFSFNGSRAVPTIDGSTAYCVGAMGSVYCLNLIEHNLIWHRDFKKDFNVEVPTWAFSQAPLIYEDLVIVAPQSKQAGVVAFNKDSGKIVWTTPRLSHDPGYSSPKLATIGGVDQIIQIAPNPSPEKEEDDEEKVEEEDEDEDEEDEDEEDEEPQFEGGGVYGIEASSGKILWNYQGFYCVITIPPVTLIGDGRILITGGYEASTTMIEVQPKDGRFEVREIYKKENVKSQIHPAILFDSHLYLLGNGNDSKEGLTCMTLDGEVLWKTKRKPNFERGGFLLADGHFYIVDGKQGDLYLVKASHKGYEELGKVKMLKKNQVWAPLTLSDGKLLIRDQEQLKCVDIK